ncbi:WD40 repeat-like protein [Mycena venus]|uniref:WD40 repeat-like protein n=1 Tax=Mycena venus TaxID=2733690 RepID=A0A8H6Z047_9AGAR|nr:WD40 repeat-like protein [Mycena venus]
MRPSIRSTAIKPSSRNQEYLFHGTLVGHTGALVCIAATEDGKLAASGGTDGTRVWSLEKDSPLERPSSSGSRGATTYLLWVRREEEPAEILIFGTQLGLLVCWKQASPSAFEERNTRPLTGDAEVTGLDFDPATNRLLACNRNSVVACFTIERGTLALQPVFSVAMTNVLPKAIAFGEYINNEKEVLVFGMYDGRIYSLRGTTGEVLRSRETGGLIGNASVNVRKGIYCLDDPFQGVALYRLDDDRRAKTFEVTRKRNSARARQVCFANDAGFVVSGSDHGKIYVFDRWSDNKIVDELNVGNADWVQTITSTDVNNVSTILGARSREQDGANDILVWKKAKTKKRINGTAIWGQLVSILHVVLVLGALLFLYQNLSLRT